MTSRNKAGMIKETGRPVSFTMLRRIAIETAHEAGLVLPGLEKAKELYDQLATKGMENKGTQAIIQWYLNK